MKIKLVVSAVILASVTAVGGCAGIKTAARQPVKGATSPTVQSMYAPGMDEGCTALGSESCPYLSNPLKSLFTSQTDVQIDNRAATVPPKATWYKCDRLHQ